MTTTTNMDFGSPLLRLGTSSWSSKDWLGAFYPEGTQPRDFIGVYAQRLNTVEVDSTFYGAPGIRTVESWCDQTPESFTFSLKAPQAITHERCMVECGRDLAAFLNTIQVLGPRLGPVLFQFPYFAKKNGMTYDMFCERLQSFVKELPADSFRFALEVRNKTWLQPPLFDILGSRNVALTFIDHPWMPPPQVAMAMKGAVTAPFAYIRWLGDRKGIEKLTTTWDATIIDRRKDLERWISPIQALLDKQIPVFGYFNNHYSGYAPDNLAMMAELLRGGDGTSRG